MMVLISRVAKRIHSSPFQHIQYHLFIISQLSYLRCVSNLWLNYPWNGEYGVCQKRLTSLYLQIVKNVFDKIRNPYTSDYMIKVW